MKNKTMELVLALLLLGSIWLIQEKILHRKPRPSHPPKGDEPVA